MIEAAEPIRIRFLSFFLRLIPVTIFVITLFYFIAPFYVNGHLKLFKNQFRLMHPEYEVITYGLVKKNQIDYIQFSIKVNKHSTNPDSNVKKGAIMTVNGPASTLCIAPIIILSLILAWPGLTIRKRLKALLIATPMTIVLAALDYPIIFIGNIELAYSNTPILNNIRMIFKHLMMNGGRQFLALAIFLCAVTLADLNPRNKISMEKFKRNDPCPCGSGKKYKHCCLS